MGGLIETKHGIESNIQGVDALVFEKYDSRFTDYDTKGMLLFMTTGTVAANTLTVNLNVKNGAEVFAFPLLPFTVASNAITFDTTNYADSGDISTGNKIMVAVLANQADVIEAGQPH